MFSCTETEYDYLGIGDRQHTWQEELSTIINDNADLLSASGLSLKNCRVLNRSRIDSREVLSESESLLPVYTNGLDKFILMPYDFAKSDTSTVHYDVTYLKHYVDSLALSDEDLIIAELEWMYNEQTIKTTALFNSYTKELEYDNVLFNILTTKVLNKEESKKILTRAENNWNDDAFAHGYDAIWINSPVTTETLATAFIDWAVYGHWAEINIYNSDSIIIGHNFKFVNDGIQWRSDGWAIGANTIIGQLTYIVECQDFDIKGAYSLKYLLWVGAYYHFPQSISYYSPVPNTEGISLNDVYGKGFVKAIYVTPTRAPEYF